MPDIKINGRTLHYYERGQGPVALFVHGFPLDATLWLDQLTELSDVRRSIAVDLRGSGRSEPVPGEPSTMELHASDLDSLCDWIGAEKVDLVGISMGGYIGLAFAELFGHRLRSVALLDTKSTADTDETKMGRDVLAVRVVSEGRLAVVDDLEATLLGPNAELQTRARFRSMGEGTRYETFLASLAGMKERPDRSHVLGTITGPALVLTGEHDQLVTTEESRRMCEALVGGELVIVEGAGHLTPIEDPLAVNRALRVHFARVDADCY